jgi:hypothetical protein
MDNDNFDIAKCEKLGLGYMDEAHITYVTLLKIDNNYYKLEFCDVNENYFLSDIPQKITKQIAIDLIKESKLYFSAPEIQKFIGEDIDE